MWRIEIPRLLPTFNDILAMGHWKRRNTKQEICGEVWVALKEAKVKKPLHKPIVLTVAQFYTKRMRDTDSASFAVKAFLDTLVANGYLEDDNPEYVANIIYQPPERGTVDKTVFLIQ